MGYHAQIDPAVSTTSEQFLWPVEIDGELVEMLNVEVFVVAGNDVGTFQLDAVIAKPEYVKNRTKIQLSDELGRKIFNDLMRDKKNFEAMERAAEKWLWGI